MSRYYMSDEQAFKDLVMQYVDVCNKIAATSELRKSRTEIGKKITEYMKVHGISQCNLRDGGSLVLKESKSVPPVKKEEVAEKLTPKIGYEVADQIVTDIWSNRPVKVSETLKHVRQST